jgi:RND superfamily putative drug exporter
MNSFLTAAARTLTSKRGSWLVLGGVVVVVALIFGLLSGAGEDRPTENAPADSESTQAQQILVEFPEADIQSVMVVASNDDGSELSADDQAQLKKLGSSLGQSVGDEADEKVTGPILSDDKQAALLMVPIEVGLTNSDTAETVDDLRTTIADDPTASGLTDEGMSLLVTGGPAIGADIASAFDGADFTLLIVTVVIVALLLIITYRSPILWLLPLIVIGTADGLASTVTAAVGDWLELQFDAGIISVLVFGAGANYALLLISRYREELRRIADHRTALAEAWTHTATTILASNLTVVLSLLSLVFAVIPGTRGLGITAAVGLIISAAAVLIALPPVLAICGKKMFWPFVPQVDDAVTVQNADERRHPRRGGPALGAGARRPSGGRGRLGEALGLAENRHPRGPETVAAPRCGNRHPRRHGLRVHRVLDRTRPDREVPRPVRIGAGPRRPVRAFPTRGIAADLDRGGHRARR